MRVPILQMHPIRQLILAALLIAGCDRTTTTAPESLQDGKIDALAIVGRERVTEADFQYAWSQSGLLEPTEDARRLIFSSLVSSRAQVELARREGLDRDPELRAEIDRLIISRLRADRIEKSLGPLKPTEDDLRQEYERNRESRYRQPGKVRVAVLWFDTRGQAPLIERYRPRLEAIRAQVLEAGAAMPLSEGFGSLAVSHSEHRVSRYRGGDLGWLPSLSTEDPWKAEVLNLAGTLEKPGELSAVSVSPLGLFLVRLIERQPAQDLPFPAVRDKIEQALLAKVRLRLKEKLDREISDSVQTRFPKDVWFRLDAIPLSNTPPEVISADSFPSTLVISDVTPGTP